MSYTIKISQEDTEETTINKICKVFPTHIISKFGKSRSYDNELKRKGYYQAIKDIKTGKLIIT